MPLILLSIIKKKNMTKHNDNKANNLNASPNESSLSSNRKSVTYAEHVTSLSLQISIYASFKHTTVTKPVTLSSTQSNSTTDKGNNQAASASHPVVDQATRDTIIKITKDLNEALHQLATVKTEFAQMKNRFDSIDSKLDHIVSCCNISANSSSAPNRPTLVNAPANPITKSLTPIS